MKKGIILSALLSMLMSMSVLAGEGDIGGEVSMITSYKGGLLIRLAGDVKPERCKQSSPWMIIAQEDSTMVSVALSMYMAGNRKVRVYVSDETTFSYCRITQYAPNAM